MDKIIWMLWFQGLANVPFVVRKCVESWQNFNPDWQINILDEDTLKEYVDIDPIIRRNKEFISVQSRADIIRINLLKKYGGIWVDATCLCKMPLDMWIHDVMISGFFAFRDPGPDRIMSNWFLASEKENYLIQELCNVVHTYWMKNTFDGMVKPRMRKYRKWLKNYTSKDVTRVHLWFNPIVLKVLRVYPFYCFHYLFARTVHDNAVLREIWHQTPYRSATPMHLVQSLGQSSKMTNEIREVLNREQVPLYKLSWKKAPKEGVLPDSVLEFVLMENERND